MESFYQPREPRRGVSYGAVVLLMVLGLIVGAIGGGVAGAFVATRVVQQTQPVVASIDAPVAQPVVASGDTNSAMIQAVQQVRPAVVTVINILPRQQSFGFFGATETQPRSSGSGVIISPQGYIVTNNHVVENAESLEVIYADGSSVPATLIGADPYADLAVIKVDGNVPAAAQLGDSDRLQIGETAIAIGSALGDFKNTVTSGVISAVGAASIRATAIRWRT